MFFVSYQNGFDPSPPDYGQLHLHRLIGQSWGIRGKYFCLSFSLYQQNINPHFSFKNIKIKNKEIKKVLRIISLYEIFTYVLGRNVMSIALS